MKLYQSNQGIVVIMPCYYDSASLERLIPEIIAVDSTIRILVVNDTAMRDDALDAIAEKYNIDILDAPYNMGHQGAIIYGIRAALLSPLYKEVSFFVTMDSDYQDNPLVIPRLIEAAGSDRIAVASRVGARPEGIWFGVLYALYKLIFRILVGFSPNYGNYAAYSRNIARQIALSPHFDSIYSMALHLIGAIIEHVPCPRRRRLHGQSKIGLSGLLDHALSIMLPNLRQLSKRLAMMTLFGGTFMTTVAAVIIFLRFFMPIYTMPNWATIVCFGVAILSFQMFSLCVLLFVLAASIRQTASSSRMIQLLASINSDPEGEISKLMQRFK